MTRQKKDPDRKISYLVKASDGDFVIEIPATWKVTFGYVNPSKPEHGMGGRSAHCLRVYEGEKLRAVYGNVTGFRDLAIPLARKITKETGSSTWTKDSSGNFESQTKVERAELEEGEELVAEDIPF